MIGRDVTLAALGVAVVTALAIESYIRRRQVHLPLLHVHRISPL